MRDQVIKSEICTQEIRRYREEAGISQEELGQAIGKSNVDTSDIERGRLGISFADMVLIAK
jgi:transcriptional regulator with XRE-family HTH domain